VARERERARAKEGGEMHVTPSGYGSRGSAAGEHVVGFSSFSSVDEV
jgi:hypothetical protein